MNRLLARLKRSKRLLADLHDTTPQAIPDSTPSATTVETKNTGSNTVKTSKHATLPGALEALPPEIRRYLLTVLELPELKGLVHASSVFHQQYQYDRTLILRRSIESTLGSTSAGAYAVQVFSSTSEEANEEVLQILATGPSPFEEISQPVLEQMTVFYFRCISPVIESYSLKTLENLCGEVAEANTGSGLAPEDATGLSNSERRRFTRALYHFEILCYIGRHGFRNPWLSARGRQERDLEQLFNILQPWEMEELISCYEFVVKQYESVLEKIQWDIHPDNRRFDDQGRPPTPTGAFDLSNSSEYCVWIVEAILMLPPAYFEDHIEGTALQGLFLLRSILVDIKDHDTLVRTMQQHMQTSYIPLNACEGVFGECHQTDRRENRPSERDRMQAAKNPLPFRGDHDTDAPPLAWTILWGGTYSNLYGHYTSARFRRWGFVFWDAYRLEKAGCRDMILSKEWEGMWDEEDPRDLMWVGD